MPEDRSQSADKGTANSVPASPERASGALRADSNKPQTGIPSEPNPPSGEKPKKTRRMLIGGAAVLGLVILALFGIPWIRFVLTTVSTDDAYVNGHVTFVAARVPGQVSQVLVDDNNRVNKGDLLVELDREPYEVDVAIKKAAVETARADLNEASSLLKTAGNLSFACCFVEQLIGFRQDSDILSRLRPYAAMSFGRRIRL